MLERHGQAWGLDLAEPVQLAAVLEPGEIGNVGMSFAAGLNVTGDGVSGRNYGDDFRMTIISGSLPPGLQLSLPSSEWTVTGTLYTSKHPAGGTWSTPAVVSVPGDAASSPHVVADAAGTVVASWLDSTSGALNVLTSPSGGGFGPAATFAASAFGDLKIAPGHAVLSFRSVPIAPVSISGEPVS